MASREVNYGNRRTFAAVVVIRSSYHGNDDTSDRGITHHRPAAGSELAVGAQGEGRPQFHHRRQKRQLDGVRCDVGHAGWRAEHHRHCAAGILLRRVGMVVHHRRRAGCAGVGRVLCQTVASQWMQHAARGGKPRVWPQGRNHGVVVVSDRHLHQHHVASDVVSGDDREFAGYARSVGIGIGSRADHADGARRRHPQCRRWRHRQAGAAVPVLAGGWNRGVARRGRPVGSA